MSIGRELGDAVYPYIQDSLSYGYMLEQRLF
jgi:hypothetical protein